MDEGEDAINQAPETTFSIDAINVEGDKRLNSIVRLSWYGRDPDGFVSGFEISQDQQNWSYTSSQDSTFQFSLTSGSDTVDIQLYARAIDNEGLRDPTPAFLRVPLKNTKPEASFSDDLLLPDTAFLVATTSWQASDLDGDETITQVLISINGKAWFPINRTEETFSIVPRDFNATDTTSASIYYGGRQNPDPNPIEGLVLNDTNRIYLKVVDQAGAESDVDTTLSFYMRGKKNDLLVVGGVDAAHDDYQSLLDAVGLEYDFLNLTASNGLYQPSLWNTTFRLQLSFYDKLFFYSDETTFLNSYTSLRLRLIEFAAASLQEYANSGGKYLISTKFDHDDNIDGIVGVLPIQSVSDKNYGSAWLLRNRPVARYKDSTYQIADTLNGQPTNQRDTTVEIIDRSFPVLTTNEFALQGVGVFNIDPNDTEVLYRADLIDRSTFGEWPDTKIVASARRRNGSLNQIFFSIPLFRLDNNSNQVEKLFDKIFNEEFN